MSQKDPFNTIERLTNAIEAMAISVEDAGDRVKIAAEYLVPLSEDDFPDPDAKRLFKFILDIAAKHSAAALSTTEIQNTLKNIWNLYWKMSSNERYR